MLPETYDLLQFIYLRMKNFFNYLIVGICLRKTHTMRNDRWTMDNGVCSVVSFCFWYKVKLLTER